MEDWQFEILDELYFVTGYEELEDKLPDLKSNLRIYLEDLWHQGWVKIIDRQTEEEIFDLNKFDLTYKEYNYLATKAGLMAHNSR